MTDIDSSKLVACYIKLRDKRAELKKAYEDNDSTLKSDMEIIEQQLLEICKATGSTSFRTDAGTVIRSTKTYYWTSDWEAMHNLVVQQQRPDLLERRISQSNMKDYLEHHPHNIPTGLNVESKYTVTVRRA